jgi:hypothetical protein
MDGSRLEWKQYHYIGNGGVLKYTTSSIGLFRSVSTLIVNEKINDLLLFMDFDRS